jgi:hypothetical protein
MDPLLERLPRMRLPVADLAFPAAPPELAAALAPLYCRNSASRPGKRKIRILTIFEGAVP